jgi:hypothetical protein
MNRDTIIAALPRNGWNERCIAELPLTENMTFAAGLLHLTDAEGRPVSSFTNDTWGVTIADCYKYCSMEKVPYVSDPDSMKEEDLEHSSADFPHRSSTSRPSPARSATSSCHGWR